MIRTPYSVLISGAGIAGPALAFWLHRSGVAATVVERAPAPRAGGQAVDIRGVARDVVDWMGLLPAVQDAAVDERGFAFVDQCGKHLASMPVQAFGGEGIVAEIEILRGDLSRILCEASAADVDYIFDDSIASIALDASGVHVTFERGASKRFDLVVGADGVHSRVRALLFGDDSAFVHPLGAYTAYFTSPERVDTDGWFVIYNNPDGRSVGVRPSGPHSSQAMLSFLSPPLCYERRDIAEQKRIVSDVFRDLEWETPRLLQTMRDAPDFYFDLIGQVRMPRWTQDRVALLGDAGYGPSPLTGLGTSLSLVGAYVLAGELAAADGDHVLAFARYEAALRDYVRQCQQLPPGAVGGFLPRSRIALWLRNQSMRMLTGWPLRRVAAGMFHKADAIVLKDYQAELGSPAEARLNGSRRAAAGPGPAGHAHAL
jgi:2-polyprenyl-6-methoxyphenol hydroxylase-like FAD-dependent oxidoreductase